ncbi:MAG: hypothetical protein AAF447_13750 [Myxococcota bacterium]
MSLPARSPRPRFDLRATRDRCLLTLRAPCLVGPFRLRGLELEAPVRGALDVAAGPDALLRRRLRLRRLVAEAPADAIARALPDVELLMGPELPPGTLELALADAVGVLVVRLRPLAAKGDLLAFVEDLRFVAEGPFSPWKRLAGALAERGLPFDARVGAFRAAAPLRRLLAELFLPQGWRLPALPPDFAVDLASGLRFAVRPQAQPSPELARCLREAAALPRILEGRARPSDRLPHWVEGALEGRTPGAPGALAAALEGDGPPRRWLRAHAAFRDGERSLRLRAEGAHRTAERLLATEGVGSHVPVDGAQLTALVDEALRGGTQAWGGWISRLAERGRPEALRLARAGLLGTGATVDRAEVAARAVAAVLGGWHAENDPPPEALLEEAEAIAKTVRELAPALAAARAAEACVHQLRGRLPEAAQAWRAAADAATDDPARAGLWRRRAAELLLALEGIDAAEPLFRQVLLERRDDPRTLARLAELVAERGEDEEAEALFQRVLRAPEGVPGEREDALMSASRHFVERGEGDKARPFAAALGPSLGSALRRGAPDAEDDDPSAPQQAANPPHGTGADVLAFPAQGWQRGHAAEEAPAPKAPAPEPLAPESLAPQDGAPGLADSPPLVTLVSLADRELQALLTAAQRDEAPEVRLADALDQAEAQRDAEAVTRIAEVLARLRPFPGDEALAARVSALHAALGGPPDDTP